MSSDPSSYSQAIQDFRQARRQAYIRQALAHLTGEADELLSYVDVQKALKMRAQTDRGLQEIPLDAIVGSVGRYRDFSREFLPLSNVSEERWVRVRSVATDGRGWPPIEVYQVGAAYFVLDGNHRVSVARQLGMDNITAYVTEVKTRVSLSANVTADELICKTQYADFLERTSLDNSFPDIDLTVTAPGAYRVLDEQIAWRHYLLSEKVGHEVSSAEAAAAWFVNVYSPVVQVIREKGLLRDFPDRTETDLYIWLSHHQADLQDALQWEVSAEEAVEDLVSQHPPEKPKKLVHLGDKVLRKIVPDEFEPGPPPGAWRSKRSAGWREEYLFQDILVPVSGEVSGWHAVEQALVVAKKEGGQLRGLHVVPLSARLKAPNTLAVRDRFDQMCRDAGVNGRLVLEIGPVARTISDRSRWNDLVVLNLLHPPSPKTIERLGSGLRHVIQRSSVPLLLARYPTSKLGKSLLAYDGSPQAQEALYLAAYLAQKWSTALMLLVVQERGLDISKVQSHAQQYLDERKIEADLVLMEGKAQEAILAVAAQHNCDFLIMGGYGSQPIVQAVLGSTTNQVLRKTTIPVLVCN